MGAWCQMGMWFNPIFKTCLNKLLNILQSSQWIQLYGKKYQFQKKIFVISIYKSGIFKTSW